MFVIKILFLCALSITARSSGEGPTLYYYGLEENERSLPSCGERQACSALIQRYWLPTALVRLCRCGRRQRCDEPAGTDRLMEINNRAHLQFCLPTTNWPLCLVNEMPLTVITAYSQMNPDKIEEQHHLEIELRPPEITVKCKCPNPNYWKLNSTIGNTRVYKCASLPSCTTDEFCGNVSSDLNALYQSCLCPKHHICVHNGGRPRVHMSELLYIGNGWKAYCQRIEPDSDYSYEDT